MTVTLRGLGDAQADCVALKMRDPVPGAVPTCTPLEVSEYLRWKTGVDSDIARHAAADAVNPAFIMIGLLAWGSPGTQLDVLFRQTPGPPVLYYVGAALPLVILAVLFSGGKK